MFEKKSEKGRGNLEHRAGLDWAELGWAELGLAQLSLAQLDLAHPGYFLHTCLRNKRKMPREPKALGWAGLAHSEVVPNRFGADILKPFSRKVRESTGKYDKVQENTRKYEKVRESMRKYEKVREIMRKYEKV